MQWRKSNYSREDGLDIFTKIDWPLSIKINVTEQPNWLNEWKWRRKTTTTMTGSSHVINGAKVWHEIKSPPQISLNQSIPTASSYIFGKQFERRIHSRSFIHCTACLTKLMRRRWIPFLLLLFPHTFKLTVRSLGIHSALLLMHFIRLVFVMRDTWSAEHWAIVRRTLFYVCMQLVERSTQHMCSSVIIGVYASVIVLILRHAYVFEAEKKKKTDLILLLTMISWVNSRLRRRPELSFVLDFG